MNLTDALKIYVWLFELFIAYSLVQTIRWGCALKRNRNNECSLESHRKYVGFMVWGVCWIVLGISAARSFIPELQHWSTLLRVHLAGFDNLFCLSFAAAVIFNGKKYPRIHKFFVRPCVVFGAGMVITGHVLAARLHGALLPSGWFW